jgi:hypothetical protein
MNTKDYKRIKEQEDGMVLRWYEAEPDSNGNDRIISVVRRDLGSNKLDEKFAEIRTSDGDKRITIPIGLEFAKTWPDEKILESVQRVFARSKDLGGFDELMPKAEISKEKKAKAKKLLQDFEAMTKKAEARAYSNLSLERPLSDEETEKFKKAAKEGYGIVAG